jgi:hypothetical protein
MKKAEFLELVVEINAAATQLERRLRLAVVITKILGPQMVVVGGTAEEYWTGGIYRPTDLDMCPGPLDKAQKGLLGQVGFVLVGRHWTHPNLTVAVEFPGSGDDIQQTISLPVGNGELITMISREDLYLDRLTQATIDKGPLGIEYQSALVVAGGNFEDMDWIGVKRRMEEVARQNPKLARAMKRIHAQILKEIRQNLPEIQITEGVEVS